MKLTQILNYLFNSVGLSKIIPTFSTVHEIYGMNEFSKGGFVRTWCLKVTFFLDHEISVWQSTHTLLKGLKCKILLEGESHKLVGFII